VLTHDVKSPFFTGPLRAPARLQNTFAHESFMDEIAASVKADPVEYRLRHLADPRLIEVVKSAAKTANWDTRPSPRPGNRRTGIVAGRGISCVLYEGDNGYCSVVAEVEVNQDTGAISGFEILQTIIFRDGGEHNTPFNGKNPSPTDVLGVRSTRKVSSSIRRTNIFMFRTSMAHLCTSLMTMGFVFERSPLRPT